MCVHGHRSRVGLIGQNPYLEGTSGTRFANEPLDQGRANPTVPPPGPHVDIDWSA